jgi:hypothetical protein
MRFFLLFLFLMSFATSVFAACNIVNGVAYGDCAGVSVNTGRTSFQVVDTYRNLSGISEGAQVLSGGSLVVSGTAQRVIVEQDGMAQISGIVQQVEVSGTVQVSGQVGTILLSDGGRAIVQGIVGQILGNGTALLEAGSVIAGHPTVTTREIVY